MVETQVREGDAPRPGAVKIRKQKSALADIVKGLLRVLSVHVNENHSAEACGECRAQLSELTRRANGHP